MHVIFAVQSMVGEPPVWFGMERHCNSAVVYPSAPDSDLILHELLALLWRIRIAELAAASVSPFETKTLPLLLNGSTCTNAIRSPAANAKRIILHALPDRRSRLRLGSIPYEMHRVKRQFRNTGTSPSRVVYAGLLMSARTAQDCRSPVLATKRDPRSGVTSPSSTTPALE